MADTDGDGYLSRAELVAQLRGRGRSAADADECLRDLTHHLPEFVKALAPLSRICDAINSEPRIEPMPHTPPPSGGTP